MQFVHRVWHSLPVAGVKIGGTDAGEARFDEDAARGRVVRVVHGFQTRHCGFGEDKWDELPYGVGGMAAPPGVLAQDVAEGGGTFALPTAFNEADEVASHGDAEAPVIAGFCVVLFRAVAEGKLHALSDVQPWPFPALEALIEACLAPDPAQRPTAAEVAAWSS